MNSLKKEWPTVVQLVCECANYSDSRDELLHKIKLAELRAKLNELELNYGSHPAILATKAEFVEDLEEKLELLETAFSIYESNFEYDDAMSCVTSAFNICVEEAHEKAELWLSRMIEYMQKCSDEWELEEAQNLREKWEKSVGSNRRN